MSDYSGMGRSRLIAEIEAFKTHNADLSESNSSRRDHLVNARKSAGIGPLDDLCAAIESLRKDADRYRWLRDGAGYCDTRDIPGMAPASMDAFIDDNLGKGEQS